MGEQKHDKTWHILIGLTVNTDGPKVKFRSLIFLLCDLSTQADICGHKVALNDQAGVIHSLGPGDDSKLPMNSRES